MKKYLLSIPTCKTKLLDKHIRHKFYHAQSHTPQTIKDFQSLLGKIMWVSDSRVGEIYSVGEISRRSTTASQADTLILIKLVNLSKEIAKPLILSSVKGNWKLIGVSDSAYDISTYEGRIGFEIRLISDYCSELVVSNNILCWSSKVLRNKLASTTSAEMHALLKAIKTMPLYISLAKSLTGKTPHR
eukprot:GHVR01047023.1.p1 GENE.GHVR01047023.1~~GHVR01047023.1.p1  ORF type:complete len:187 (+),score=11.95 GHVR01047023.1:247-807(+)